MIKLGLVKVFNHILEDILTNRGRRICEDHVPGISTRQNLHFCGAMYIKIIVCFRCFEASYNSIIQANEWFNGPNKLHTKTQIGDKERGKWRI